jgi:hypothetical protein
MSAATGPRLFPVEASPSARTRPGSPERLMRAAVAADLAGRGEGRKEMRVHLIARNSRETARAGQSSQFLVLFSVCPDGVRRFEDGEQVINDLLVR